MAEAVWVQAIESCEDLPRIKAKVADIWLAHNKLHYVVMHMTGFSKIGTTGIEAIKHVHEKKLSTFDEAIKCIKEIFHDKEVCDLLSCASELNNYRNQVMHGFLMEKQEISNTSPCGQHVVYKSLPQNEDRLGFGKAHIKTGEVKTVSMDEMNFWQLDEQMMDVRGSLQVHLDAMKQKNPPSLTLPRKRERGQ